MNCIFKENYDEKCILNKDCNNCDSQTITDYEIDSPDELLEIILSEDLQFITYKTIDMSEDDYDKYTNCDFIDVYKSFAKGEIKDVAIKLNPHIKLKVVERVS